jgi:glycine cleavage system aminomethyltransferase T
VGAGGPLAAALLLPQAGREQARRGEPRDHGHAELLGLLDASTLGKIIVKGPDAGRFMDMLYTNMMSTLKPGKCRYGLMCSENGFLMDDGVVARLDEDTFLCHTTTGGADRIHGMDGRLAAMRMVGLEGLHRQRDRAMGADRRGRPQGARGAAKARRHDLSKDALPFMGWTEGKLGGSTRGSSASPSPASSASRSRSRQARAWRSGTR